MIKLCKLCKKSSLISRLEGKGREKSPKSVLNWLPHALADLPPDEELPLAQQQLPSFGFAGNSVHLCRGQTPGGHQGFSV